MSQFQYCCVSGDREVQRGEEKQDNSWSGQWNSCHTPITDQLSLPSDVGAGHKQLQQSHYRSLITHHPNKYSNNAKVRNIASITKL